MKKLRTAFLEKPSKGRRLVISDIHGCSRTFKKLLNKVELTKQDQLFLLGDVINKGPHSAKVLNRIIKLQNDGYSVFFIRGNHEQIVLNCKKKTVGQRKRSLKSLSALELLDGKKIQANYFELLKGSYHFIETEKHFLVHAGFNTIQETFSDQHAMLQTRDFRYDTALFQGKQIIIGHTPSRLKKIKRNLELNKPVICIDNGCIHINEEGEGKLLCLNMDTNAIYTQKYVEH